MDAETLLRRWGFFSHPFRDTVAELQRNSAQLFVPPPYFADVVGDRERPRSALVYGSRGDGKSALKEAVRDAFKMTRDFLIIEYSNFSSFVDHESIAAATFNLHIQRVLELLSDALLCELEEKPDRILNFSIDQRSQLQWHLLYYPPNGSSRSGERRWLRLLNGCSDSKGFRNILKRTARTTGGYLRRKRVEVDLSGEQVPLVGAAKFVLALLTPGVPNSAQRASENGLQGLKELLSIIRTIGLRGIVILVDRLDETPLTSQRPDLMSALIKPILLSIPFLELEGVAAKFFLPRQVYADLHREIRSDRILTRSISWSAIALKELLARRLATYSDGKVNSLRVFVETDIADLFEKAVFFYSAGNPRNMLRILDSVVTEVCNLQAAPSMIYRLGLEAGIREFLRIRTSEGDASEYEERLREREKLEVPPLPRT